MARINLLRPTIPQPRLHARLQEQLEYLEGVLWTDPSRRLNPHTNPDDIDPHTSGTIAFWRGFLEVGGSIGVYSNGTDRRYPWVTIKASYPVLCKFLDFMEDELSPTLSSIIASGNHVVTKWDDDSKLRNMAGSGQIKLTGKLAQDVCRILYPPSSVIGLDSIRSKVDEILTWVPRC